MDCPMFIQHCPLVGVIYPHWQAFIWIQCQVSQGWFHGDLHTMNSIMLRSFVQATSIKKPISKTPNGFICWKIHCFVCSWASSIQIWPATLYQIVFPVPVILIIFISTVIQGWGAHYRPQLQIVTSMTCASKMYIFKVIFRAMKSVACAIWNICWLTTRIISAIHRSHGSKIIATWPNTGICVRQKINQVYAVRRTGIGACVIVDPARVTDGTVLFF